MGVVCATEDSATNNMVLASSSGDAVPLSESAGNNVLSATHDISKNTVQDIKNYFNGSVEINPGDTVYLGNKSFTSDWQVWHIMLLM